jgi:hypothetical protein
MTSRQREGIGSFCCGRITHKGARASSRKKSWKSAGKDNERKQYQDPQRGGLLLPVRAMSTAVDSGSLRTNIFAEIRRHMEQDLETNKATSPSFTISGGAVA